MLLYSEHVLSLQLHCMVYNPSFIFAAHSHHGSPQAPHEAQDCQKENQEVHSPPI